VSELIGILGKVVVLGLVSIAPVVCAQTDGSVTDTRPSVAPDIREDESKLKLQKGNFVAVPIPISDPTLDAGLIAGAAYFYAQTEEQRKAQPASVTGAAAMYTANDSRAAAIVQQNYWRKNRWRFTGALGAADLRLSLLAPDEDSGTASVDWRINGTFFFARLSRKVSGNWYAGVFARTVDANQSLGFGDKMVDFDTNDVRTVGIGLTAEYDSRDLPINTYGGRYFKAQGLFHDEAIGGNDTYQSYDVSFKSYHEMTDSIVLAWEALGCFREGTVPLWDTCRIKLRGFPATNYLGEASYSVQAELRWRMSKRWGLVAFGGAGEVANSFSGFRDRASIPSYGAGLRFSVLPAKRVNMRLDYAKSRDSDAIHFSVGEAF
jgi:outer membrane protein assembly factor BamA